MPPGHGYNQDEGRNETGKKKVRVNGEAFFWLMFTNNIFVPKSRREEKMPDTENGSGAAGAYEKFRDLINSKKQNKLDTIDKVRNLGPGKNGKPVLTPYKVVLDEDGKPFDTLGGWNAVGR